jgi:hypothetical protein
VPGKCRKICSTQQPDYPQEKHRKCREAEVRTSLAVGLHQREESKSHEKYFPDSFSGGDHWRCGAFTEHRFGQTYIFALRNFDAQNDISITVVLRERFLRTKDPCRFVSDAKIQIRRRWTQIHRSLRCPQDDKRQKKWDASIASPGLHQR